jgi:hypothetical protein
MTMAEDAFLQKETTRKPARGLRKEGAVRERVERT